MTCRQVFVLRFGLQLPQFSWEFLLGPSTRKMKNIDDWEWAIRPATEGEFELMMSSLDMHLAACGCAPNQRDLNAARLVSMRLGFSGTSLMTHQEARGSPFSAADIFYRIPRWFEHFYGKRAHLNFAHLRMIVSLRRTVWRLDLPMVFGKVETFASRDLPNKGITLGTEARPASSNILTALSGISQPFADSISLWESIYLLEAARLGLDSLPLLAGGEHDPLVARGQADYISSVHALLDGRTHEARWSTSQCAEKIIKALLLLRGASRLSLVKAGHALPDLGKLLEERTGLVVSTRDLCAIHCDPKVRYGEGEAVESPERALASHYALLRLLRTLNIEHWRMKNGIWRALGLFDVP